eukprot:TRINITY_DN99139_c0_g2_i1.p1 TRINITY_DN99139_c0_g2~~TRINITY_DN99139_c0_g2_i1.p1  ORF type:complete len:163 (-),score=23.10 TRINITY_DN99139_c0_g2_i1:10-498(-)
MQQIAQTLGSQTQPQDISHLSKKRDGFLQLPDPAPRQTSPEGSKVRKRQRALQAKVVPERELRPTAVPVRTSLQTAQQMDGEALGKSSLMFRDGKTQDQKHRSKHTPKKPRRRQSGSYNGSTSQLGGGMEEDGNPLEDAVDGEIGRAVQQECRDRSRMPSSA